MSSATTSTALAASRATQYTVLNASLEKLQKNLEVLEQQVEVTVAQSEWTKRLLLIHSSLMMASSQVLREEGRQEAEYEDQEEP
ncbi:hypothetical protein BGZ98_007751 [Dissophora globulifera]|uniref:Uncharacterized protein n=1 Tax=Dissophora globulifera TaxID=979702 RepID=A0A9P6UU30_9FUNG|nr:hypothetical protein BGZ98_007751 [Dissophora globulifera]KAG0319654.1 hypothetical protein BGZ99_004985 [Dissophora globulifera]